MPLIIIPLELTPFDNDVEDGIYSLKTGEITVCGVDDGTHKARVEYYNPFTGHNAYYTLKVQVENCKVKQINFPNGGWLDESHIPPTALNQDGRATLEDDKGRIYDVDIDA